MAEAAALTTWPNNIHWKLISKAQFVYLQGGINRLWAHNKEISIQIGARLFFGFSLSWSHNLFTNYPIKLEFQVTCEPNTIRLSLFSRPETKLGNRRNGGREVTGSRGNVQCTPGLSTTYYGNDRHVGCCCRFMRHVKSQWKHTHRGSKRLESEYSPTCTQSSTDMVHLPTIPFSRGRESEWQAWLVSRWWVLRLDCLAFIKCHRQTHLNWFLDPSVAPLI